MLKTLKEVQTTRESLTYPAISLNKLLNSKVVDIEGYVSTEFGDPTFKVCRLVLENGQVIFVEGEHDIAYIIDEDVEGLKQEQLAALEDEQNKEDGI